ncbi:MAG TPA: hypothetical protein VF139_14935 [Candidatus Polarisedimenticolaceae bacterium]
MRVSVLLAAILALAASCSAPSAPSNTGYTGTWTRSNDRAASVIAILHDTGGYKFRWNKVSYDERGKVALVVDCEWNGDCVELLKGERVATFRHKAAIDPETGHLVVEAVETREKPTAFTHRIVDEFVLDPDGLRMTAYTRERQGQTYSGDGRPMKHFVKVADGVAFPPGTLR